MDLGGYLAFVKNDKIIDGNTNQGLMYLLNLVESQEDL